MNRQLLEQPFAPEQIKQRSGSFGATLDYIEGHVVIQRLNDSFDANWSFEVLSHQINMESDEVIVLGKLTAEQISKTQFGSSRITRNRDTGEIVSLADDLKAAATDALKKGATLWGIGLHIYGDKSNQSQSRLQHTPSQPPAAHHHPSQNNNNGGNGGQKSRITNKQLNYVLSLGKEQGMDSKALEIETLTMFGVKLSYLTTSEASALIDTLKRKAA